MSMTKKDSVGRAGPGAVHVVLARVVLCSSNVTEERAMWRQTTSVPTAVEYYYVNGQCSAQLYLYNIIYSMQHGTHQQLHCNQVKIRIH